MLKLFVLLFLVSSCSSYKASSGSAYQKSADYQARHELTESFLAKGPGNLSDEAIHKLLNSKIKKQDNVKLAILKLGHQGIDYSFYPEYYEEHANVDRTETKILDTFMSGTSIKSITMIPSFLLPQSMTLANLRDSAAILQANYLLIMKTNSRSDFDFNIFSPDEAIAIANMEVALMDVSTGVIPYTALISGKKKIKKKDKDDFNSHEFRIRARKEAEQEAFLNLAKDLKEFF